MPSNPTKCKVQWCQKRRNLSWESFHEFPKENARLHVWCNAIGIDPNPKLVQSKSNKVCSDHFSNDQLTSHNKLRLEKNAVPYLINPGYRRIESGEGVVQELPGKSISRSTTSTSAKSAFKLIASKSSAVSSTFITNPCQPKRNLTNVGQNVYPMTLQSSLNSKSHSVSPPLPNITSHVPAASLDTSVLRINTADVVRKQPGKSVLGSTFAGSTSLVELAVKTFPSSVSSAPNPVKSTGPCRKKFKFSRITSTSKSQSSNSHATSDRFGPSNLISPCPVSKTTTSSQTPYFVNINPTYLSKTRFEICDKSRLGHSYPSKNSNTNFTSKFANTKYTPAELQHDTTPRVKIDAKNVVRELPGKSVSWSTTSSQQVPGLSIWGKENLPQTTLSTPSTGNQTKAYPLRLRSIQDTPSRSDISCSAR